MRNRLKPHTTEQLDAVAELKRLGPNAEEILEWEDGTTAFAADDAEFNAAGSGVQRGGGRRGV